MDPQDLRKRFESELKNTDWKSLGPHFEKDRVLSVNESLDIIDVAIGIATDDADAVNGWVSTNKIIRPTKEEADRWLEDDCIFHFLIVQPFVLVKKLNLA